MQHESGVISAAFDPTGERIVTASYDNTARIWDAKTGAPIGKPLQHEGQVNSAAFDPTGERIVTASEDKTARVWDAKTGAPIGKPLQHERGVNSAAFDPTGERIVTVSEDNTARIWAAPLAGDTLLSQVRTTLGRNVPEPLRLPSTGKPHLAWQDYIYTAAKGFSIIWTWTRKTIGSL